MPDRDYYLKDDARSRGVRANYEAHISKMLELQGDAPELHRVRAKVVLDLETRMAQAQWTRVEFGNPQKTSNKRTLDPPGRGSGFELEGLHAGRVCSWQISTSATLPLPRPFGKLASEVPAPQWRTYLRCASPQCHRQPACQGLRRRGLRLPWQGARRDCRAGAPRQRRRGRYGWHARRCPWPALCQEPAATAREKCGETGY